MDLVRVHVILDIVGPFRSEDCAEECADCLSKRGPVDRDPYSRYSDEGLEFGISICRLVSSRHCRKYAAVVVPVLQGHEAGDVVDYPYGLGDVIGGEPLVGYDLLASVLPAEIRWVLHLLVLDVRAGGLL